MKSFIKKITVVISVMSISLIMTTAAVTATESFRSGPNATAAITDTAKSAESSGNEKAATAASSSSQTPSSVTTQASTQNTQGKKYLTKWGGFFWFLLSVVVNFILSCWIGNRFYRLSRQSAQSSAEIRALRKDIEERFAATLTDIDEPATEVINRNESYARTDDGIEMPPRRPSVAINDEEREILGRWDTKRTASKMIEDDEPRVSESRSYSPKRVMSGIEFEDDEDDSSEEEKSEETKRATAQIREKMESVTKAGNKAKDFLSNIFPFED